MRMLKPQNVPYGRHNDYILKYISVEILVKVVRWNSAAKERDLSHGLGADFSLPHCLVPGGKVSESNLEPSPAGISEPRAEISG